MDLLSVKKAQAIVVEVGLYHGGDLLVPIVRTSDKPLMNHPRWSEMLALDIRVCDIPIAARLCLTVVARRKGKKGAAKHRDSSESLTERESDGFISTASMMLFDYKGALHTGPQQRRMWPMKSECVMCVLFLCFVCNVVCGV